MPTNILMPALSPTMEKGNLARWLKKEGDKIKAGDIIAEIETDKATMEYEAVDEGTLAKIVVPEGAQDVAVNAVIAVLASEGEDVKAAAASAGKTTAPTRALEKLAAPSFGASAAPRPHPSRRALRALLRMRRREAFVLRRAQKRPSRRARAGVSLAPTAFSPPRWRDDWQRTRVSISIACKAPARMAA